MSNMFVILGEKGDTDHEEMIAGSHKTIILGGIVGSGSEELLRSPESYQKEDIFPSESPIIISNANGINSEEILKAVKDASMKW